MGWRGACRRAGTPIRHARPDEDPRVRTPALVKRVEVPKVEGDERASIPHWNTPRELE